MKTFKQYLIEIFAASDEMKSNIFYHGTPSKAGFEGIKKEGLKIDPDIEKTKYKGQENFAPLPGVYMTKEFGNAIRYSFMSNVEDDEWLDYIKQEPNGYIFEFSGKDLTQITPDEDELGSIIVKLINAKKLTPELQKIVNDIPEEFKKRVTGTPESNVNFESIAVLGKWAVKRLSDATQQYLIKRYRNVVNYGNVKPIAYWIIPKPKERFLTDRQGTFNTYGGYINYAKKFGKRYEIYR